jgi:hypothetical protein
MFELRIDNKDYKVQFGFNDFCDTDLLDRVQDIMVMFSKKDDDSVENGMKSVKDMFLVTRELLFLGFRRNNPVESIQEVGDLLDIYKKEGTEDDEHTLLSMFGLLTEDLLEEGFLSDLLKSAAEAADSKKVVPMDHQKKRSTTKKK